MSVILDGSRYRVTVPWGSDLVAAIRRIPGRRVESRNVWSVPVTYGAALHAAVTAHGIEMEYAPGMTAPAIVEYAGGNFALRFDFTNQELVKSAASVPGSVWFQPEECWLVPASAGVQVHLWAEEASAQVSSAAEDAIAYAFEAGVRYMASAAKDAEDPLTREGFGIELFPEQRAGVRYILEHTNGRCIIGDEPGVGKTAQAMAVLHELKALPAIVICPASLKVNWRREIRRAMPYASVEIIRGTRPQPRLLWADVVIINYDILDSWIGNLPNPLAVIADESHWIKNPAITRTKSTLALMAEVPDTPGTARLCLTGTPVPNRTNEIMTQLQAIGRINEFGGLATARKTWKNRPADLNRKLRETCYVRRLKKDVWPADSPERDWAELYLEPDPKILAEYRTAEADIVAYLGEKARKAAIASGATDQAGMRAAWEAAMRASAAEHLVAITHLKQLAAKAALPAAKAWAKEFLSGGEKLGIFAWHRAIVDELAVSLNGVKVQGGQSETERQRSVDLFQNRPEVKVFVGQIKAAGEGLTLTAACTALLLEQAWNQATHDQVLDRFHRRGQEHDVTGYVALIEGTITEDIQRLIRRKQVEVNAAVDGNAGATETSVLQDLVVLLSERGMENGQARS